MKISEIQDLFILPEYRGMGLGKKLVLHCEQSAKNAGNKEIGIGVGVLPLYGAAQSLYVSLGYVPDGQGLNKDRESIIEGANISFDHDLALMFIKKII